MVLAMVSLNMQGKNGVGLVPTQDGFRLLTVYRVDNVVLNYPRMRIVGGDNIDQGILIWVIVLKYI